MTINHESQRYDVRVNDEQYESLLRADVVRWTMRRDEYAAIFLLDSYSERIWLEFFPWLLVE